MIDKAHKLAITKRLSSAGLAKLAKAMMTDLRRKWRKEKGAAKIGTSLHDKENSSRAWEHVWDLFEPICETIERLKADVKTKQPQAELTFVGFQGNPARLIDPDYEQDDRILKYVDAYLWLEDEFRLVVTDSPTGTTLDFRKATRKPPTVFTVQICEEYARAKPGSPQRKKIADDIHKAIGKLPSKTSAPSGKIGYAGDT